MKKPNTFDAPSNAPAHIALRQAVADAGLDIAALRNLLWLMNAHPLLIGHAQIFQHIHQILLCQVFECDSVTWAKEWISNTESWALICQWAWDNRVTLSRKPNLAEFHKHSRNHPIMNEGIVRHPITGALWNEWEIEATQAPKDLPTATPNPYHLLQAHLFGAYADARFRLSTLDQYEGHWGKNEFPIAPTRGGPVSIAVREFSLAIYAPVLTTLPQISDTFEFAKALLSHTPPLANIDLVNRYRAEVYFDRIRRFFKRFLDVREGYRPPQTLRFGWQGGKGSGQRYPGFIDMSLANDLAIEAHPTAVDHEDPDIPAKRLGRTVFASPRGNLSQKSATEDTSPNALEASGLAPTELLEELVTLVPADQLRKNLFTLHNQRAAMEMRGQHLPFDYANLTPEEIFRVWEMADRAIRKFRESDDDHDELQINATAGLVLKLSLAYGLSIENIGSISWLHSTPNHEALPSMGNAHLPGLLYVDSDEERGWQFLGLLQAPLTPDYATPLAPELEDLDPSFMAPFVLPDDLKLDDDFSSLLEERPKNGQPVFNAPIPAIKAAVNRLIKECRNQRISVQKISQTLHETICFLSGDQTLASVTTGNQAAANEPRMFYARVDIDTAVAAYRRAARRIGKFVGIRIPAKQSSSSTPSDKTRLAGGARFVLDKEWLSQLIAGIKTELLAKDVEHDSLDDVARYHNLYVLYAHLYQALSTTLRAIREPVELFNAWKAHHTAPRILCGLSDKESAHLDKTRLVLIPQGLAKQYRLLGQHHAYLSDKPRFRMKLTSAAIQSSAPFFFINNYHQAIPSDPKSVAKALADFSEYPIPANFHRAFMRSELSACDYAIEVIDAFLGHANLGESPFGKFSTFDYSLFIEQIEGALIQLHAQIGLTPIASRAIPYPLRRELA